MAGNGAAGSIPGEGRGDRNEAAIEIDRRSRFAWHFSVPGGDGEMCDRRTWVARCGSRRVLREGSQWKLNGGSGELWGRGLAITEKGGGGAEVPTTCG